MYPISSLISDSIAKQCLAVKRITSGIKYYYANCDMNLLFACLQGKERDYIVYRRSGPSIRIHFTRMFALYYYKNYNL